MITPSRCTRNFLLRSHPANKSLTKRLNSFQTQLRRCLETPNRSYRDRQRLDRAVSSIRLDRIYPTGTVGRDAGKETCSPSFTRIPPQQLAKQSRIAPTS